MAAVRARVFATVIVLLDHDWRNKHNLIS